MGTLDSDRYDPRMVAARRPSNPVRPGFYWPTLWSVAAVLAAVALPGGCTRPDAASTNKTWPGDQLPPNVVLDGGKGGRTVEAMREPAAGDRPRPLVTASAPSGVRWSDVETAIRNVCSKQFLGVAEVKSTASTMAVTVQQPDGQAGRIDATLEPGGEIALRVSLGVFGDQPREEAFAKAFNTELLRLGTVRKPQA